LVSIDSPHTTSYFSSRAHRLATTHRPTVGLHYGYKQSETEQTDGRNIVA